MNRALLDNIFYALGIVGGLILLVGSILPRTRARSSRHHCVALFIAGFAGTTWAVLGYLIHFSHPNLAPHTLSLLHHYKDLCSGAAIAVLLLEFVSGEFFDARGRDRELRKQPPNTPPTNAA